MINPLQITTGTAEGRVVSQSSPAEPAGQEFSSVLADWVQGAGESAPQVGEKAEPRSSRASEKPKADETAPMAQAMAAAVMPLVTKPIETPVAPSPEAGPAVAEEAPVASAPAVGGEVRLSIAGPSQKSAGPASLFAPIAAPTSAGALSTSARMAQLAAAVAEEISTSVTDVPLVSAPPAQQTAQGGPISTASTATPKLPPIFSPISGLGAAQISANPVSTQGATVAGSDGNLAVPLDGPVRSHSIRETVGRIIQRLMERADIRWNPRGRVVPSSTPISGEPVATPVAEPGMAAAASPSQPVASEAPSAALAAEVSVPAAPVTEAPIPASEPAVANVSQPAQPMTSAPAPAVAAEVSVPEVAPGRQDEPVAVSPEPVAVASERPVLRAEAVVVNEAPVVAQAVAPSVQADAVVVNEAPVIAMPSVQAMPDDGPAPVAAVAEQVVPASVREIPVSPTAVDAAPVEMEIPTPSPSAPPAAVAPSPEPEVLNAAPAPIVERPAEAVSVAPQPRIEASPERVAEVPVESAGSQTAPSAIPIETARASVEPVAAASTPPTVVSSAPVEQPVVVAETPIAVTRAEQSVVTAETPIAAHRAEQRVVMDEAPIAVSRPEESVAMAEAPVAARRSRVQQGSGIEPAPVSREAEAAAVTASPAQVSQPEAVLTPEPSIDAREPSVAPTSLREPRADRVSASPGEELPAAPRAARSTIASVEVPVQTDQTPDIPERMEIAAPATPRGGSESALKPAVTAAPLQPSVAESPVEVQAAVQPMRTEAPVVSSAPAEPVTVAPTPAPSRETPAAASAPVAPTVTASSPEVAEVAAPSAAPEPAQADAPEAVASPAVTNVPESYAKAQAVETPASVLAAQVVEIAVEEPVEAPVAPATSAPVATKSAKAEVSAKQESVLSVEPEAPIEPAAPVTEAQSARVAPNQIADAKPTAANASPEPVINAASTTLAPAHAAAKKSSGASGALEAVAEEKPAVAAAGSSPSSSQADQNPLVMAAHPVGKTESVSRAAASEMPVVSPRHFVDQIVRSVRVEVSQGRSEMNIRLDPPDLGHLQVRLTSEAGVVTAGFHAESAGVKALLEAHLPALKNALSDAGVQVQHFSVSTGSEFGQLGQQSMNHQDPTPMHQPAARTPEAAPVAETAIPTGRVADPDGAVDYFA